jgi:PST family polysaccharide transporter
MLNFFTSYGFLLYKVLESKFSDLFKELIKPFGLSIILLLEMVLAVHFIDFSNSFLTLLIRGMIWGVSLVLLCLISGEWKKIIQLLQSK